MIEQLRTAKIAKKGPYVVELKAGKSYRWCRCGLSSEPPFCDGSHKETGYSPVKFTVMETKKYGLCGCKQSKNKPFCDATHREIE